MPFKVKEKNPRPILEASAGPAKGMRYVLLQNQITVGRSRDNDIAIEHPRISRQHALFVNVGDDLWKLRDLNSQNGVKVNGELGCEFVLKAGDRIQIGETEFIFHFEKEEVPLPFVPSLPTPPLAEASPTFSLSTLTPETPLWATKKFPKKHLFWGVLGVGLVVIAFSLTRPKHSGLETVTLGAKVPSASPDLDTMLLLEPPQLGDGEERNINLVLADRLYQKGHRELLAKNYRRAIEDLETALTLYPSHELSKLRLEEATTGIQKEIEENFRLGRSYFDSMLDRLATYHFTKTIELLGNQKNSSPLYSQAVEFLELSKARMQR